MIIPKHYPEGLDTPMGVLVPVVVRVHTRDDRGRPLECSVAYPDVPVEMVHGDQFLIMYMRKETVEHEKK